MADTGSKISHLLARSLTAILGLASIVWAISSIPVYRNEAFLADTALGILQGEKYTDAQLGALKLRLDAISAGRTRSSALNDLAVLRLRLAEQALMTNNPQTVQSALASLQTVVTDALAGTPTDSFSWLTAYWLDDVHGTAADHLNLLRMSYSTGPHEAWIAIRRNPFALRSFSSLPDDLADLVLTEFANLVRSGLYEQAAIILAGPGWPFHDKLLGQLADLDEGSRWAFARALYFKDLDPALVPGIHAQRPARPF